MDFLEDIFDRNRQRNERDHHGHNSQSDRYKADHYQEDDDSRYSMESFRPIIAKVLQNKPLLIGLAAGTILILITGVVLLLAFLPIIAQIFEYVNKNGIKGVVDVLLPLIERLWQGQS